MKKIVIDSMIMDLIIETSGLLDSIRIAGERAALVILATHVLRDQLAVTPDPEQRKRLLAVYDALPKENVPTRGFVFDISPLNGARLGEGDESDLSLEQVKTGGHGGWHDALIATTASGDGDVLVTEDKDLIKKVRRAKADCEVWNFERFVEFVQTEGQEG